MSKEDIDLIKNHPKKAINKLMVPIIISCFVEAFNSIIDSIWVSGLGSDALTALGFVSPLFVGLIGIGVGLGIGINSVISRRIGKKDLDEANNAAIHSILLSIVLSVILTAVIMLFLKEILIALGAGIVLSEATDYAFYIFLGTYSLLIPSMLSGILMAEGAVKKATYPLIAAALINIVLDPIFIYVLNLGISGAAIATVLAQTIAIIIMAYWLFIKGNTLFEYKKAKYKSNIKIYKEILLIGIPAGLEEVALAVLCIVVNILLLEVSNPDSVAAFAVAWRIISLGVVPAIGVGSASVTVAGVAYGARNYKNLNITTNYATIVGTIISLGIFIVLNVFSNQIAIIFAYSDSSSYLAPLISHVIRISSFYLLPAALGDVATYVFQGMGKGITSFILIVNREVVTSLIFVYIVGIILNFGADGIYVGLTIGAFVGSLMAFVYNKYYIKRLEKISKKLSI